MAPAIAARRDATSATASRAERLPPNSSGTPSVSVCVGASIPEACFVAIYAFFAVLITGRFPRGAFEFMVGTFRWAYRVSAYFHLMTDAYPPFSLADDPAYPVRLNIEYPEQTARWRPLVQWLLAWPYLVVAGVLYWLTGLLTILAFFTILFTRQIPRGIFELMVPGLRWSLRGNAYAYFLTTRYPPFVWG